MRRSPTSRTLAAPRFWPAVTVEDARDEWEALRRWVDGYVERFAIDSRTIPSCWYRHNAMVEALAALRDHEQASYEYALTKDAAVDFIRATADIGHFLRDQASRCGCTAAEHRADTTGRARHTDDTDWLAFVGLDVERREMSERDDAFDD